MTINNAELADPIYIAKSRTDVVSRSNTYVGVPFAVDLPQEREGEAPRVQLGVGNVSQIITSAIRTITNAADTKLEVVLASNPDVVEAGPFDFTLKDVEVDALVARGDLSYEDLLNEPSPGDLISPSTFPGTFRAINS